MNSLRSFTACAAQSDSEEYEDEDEEMSSSTLELKGTSRDAGITPRGSNGKSSSPTIAALKSMFTKCIAYFLIFVPISLVLWNAFPSLPPVVHFFGNMFAIIPLSWVISESTEHLEAVVGPMWGTLLNSTFGNVVEILLSISAIKEGLIEVVQNSLLGAIIMNCTGVLGLCVLAASGKRSSVKFNLNFALYNLGLLSVSLLALNVPTQLAVFDDWSTPTEMAKLSRIVAGMMLFMYIQWLVFNLYSHSSLFDSKKVVVPHELSAIGNATHWEMEEAIYRAQTQGDLSRDGSRDRLSVPKEDSDDEKEEDTIAAPCACLMLLISTILVAFHCEYLVASIEPLTEELHVKTAFVAVVILPMVGNFSEVIAAVSIACKGKIDLAIGVAISSATQISLCVIPIAVFIGWAYDKNLDLDFEDFQVRILGTVIVVVLLVFLDGKATWLKGTLLITVYVIVATAFWYLHNREFESAGEIVPNQRIQSLNKTIAGMQKDIDTLNSSIIEHHR